jgi:hypothetical protein
MMITFLGSTAIFSLAVRDGFEHHVLSSNVSNFAAHLIVSGFPALHATFVPQESGIMGFVTPSHASSNASVMFRILEQGLAATMYSDTSLRNAVRSSDVKNIEFLIDSVLFPSDVSTFAPQESYGFRWLGFFKPQQFGIW